MLTIEGYADRLSVQAGDEIGFHISTNAPSYDIEIARVGATREPVWSRVGIEGRSYPTPENASSYGCSWPAAVHVPVPQEWQSGYYSALLRASAADGRTALGELAFVVRSAHPGRDTSILLQLTTNTDCAYNTWGGSTFYSGPDGPARRLSFARPFAGFRLDESLFLFDAETAFADALNGGVVTDRLKREFSAHGYTLSRHFSMTIEEPGRLWHVHDPGGIYAIRKEGSQLRIYDGYTVWESCWHHWQQPFVAWAERAGFRLDYAVNGDLEFHPEILENYRLVPQRRPRRILVLAHAGQPGGVHRRRRQCGLFQRQQHLVAGALRGGGTGPCLLEGGLRAGPGLRARQTSGCSARFGATGLSTGPRIT